LRDLNKFLPPGSLAQLLKPLWLEVNMLTLRIWDLPTRVFHWALAACVIGLIITANVGGNAMVWHFRMGYAVLTLLLFRLVWGFVGGHWSRWAHLPLRPGHVLAYLKGDHSSSMGGHNPLGSWSVVLMLMVFFFQVATGLISDDEIANAGPLTAWVSGDWVSWATSWHKHWGQWLVLFGVSLHLMALAWYRFKKQTSLVPAMLHGNKVLAFAVPESNDRLPQRLLALALFVLAAIGVGTLVTWGT
jgi:cytochrome b